MGASRTVETHRHDSPVGRWELARAEPHPALRPWVREYQGYIESAPQTIRRREVPSPVVALILNLGPRFRMIDPHDGSLIAERGSFVAGLHDRYAIVDSTGAADCMQVDFTPVGAYRFFGTPMHRLSHTTTELGEVLGAEGERLVVRLYEAPTWADRFDLLDGYIARRIGASRKAPEGLVWALEQLQNTDGRTPIARLASELGWSRKRLLKRFREHVGIPAKTVARVLRFDHALKRLEQSEAISLAALAADCGYADQAHMSREFRDLSGWPPSELVRRNLSAGEGILEP